ncbi:hypothetical protein SLEP1_g30309 [Rubroshorea leprosula]|uniref:PTM/DIR17-like Tudor domain-containing protein n=1 Tax=Rubroshorea leprosula TaxID=152421 RepID=A0AAV5K8C4_9ROSI|nr:hypothetical protein SLEP1_g30309 [Rubroshorea leprosula]
MNDSMKFSSGHRDKEEDHSKVLGLEDIAQFESRSVPEPLQLPTDNPNELLEKNKRQKFIISLEAMEHKRIMAYEARKWVGVLVYKEINDRLGYLGKVQAYDEVTKLYKIMYDEESYEELTKEEMMKIVASPHLACEYLALKETKEKEQVEKIKTTKAKSSAKRKKRSSMRQFNTKEKAKKTKASDYVPLAFSEKKRDDYYWY